MELYLVKLKDTHPMNYEDGVYTGFVVSCKSENDARKIHPSGLYSYTEKEWKFIIKDRQSTMYCPRNTTWVEPNEVSELIVKHIGLTLTCSEGEILLTS